MVKDGALPAVLLVTGHMGAMACVAEVSASVPCMVEVVENRKAALVALRRGEFSAVVIDEAVAEDDGENGRHRCERIDTDHPSEEDRGKSLRGRLQDVADHQRDQKDQHDLPHRLGLIEDVNAHPPGRRRL